MSRLSTDIPLSLYVHVPWCVRKCPYCDFNSHALRQALPETAYIAALAADLSEDLELAGNRPLDTVFIGGGTPSLLSAAAVAALLDGIRTTAILHDSAEITLEANPGTLETGRFAAFREAGVTRLSVGVQSLDDSKLEALGRVHDRQQALTAIEAALESFDSVNVDLMFGLPEQTVVEALADLDQVIALGPQHISHYQLTLEPNTLFHKYPPKLPTDDQAWEIQQACMTRLAAAGYQHYEVSAYAKRGHRCRHNLNYWEFGDYLGIGAGAHAKITDPAKGRIQRAWKHKHPRTYLDAAREDPRSCIGQRQSIAAAELPFEFMMNALRLNAGVPQRLFAERTGLAAACLSPGIDQARQQGLLDSDPGRFAPSELGRRFLNDLLTLFLADA